MDFIEKAEKEIRELWFSNHTVDIRGEEGLQVIYWEDHSTCMYAVKYVLSGRDVFISGDIGGAVYTLTCRATLDNIKDFNLGYFTSKLSAFCEDRWNFDSELAKEELDTYWNDYEIDNSKGDNQEIYDGICSAIEESSSLESYRAWLMTVYESTSIDSDRLEYIWDFGQRMPMALIGYWVGLQMIIEKVQNEK